LRSEIVDFIFSVQVAIAVACTYVHTAEISNTTYVREGIRSSAKTNHDSIPEG